MMKIVNIIMKFLKFIIKMVKAIVIMYFILGLLGVMFIFILLTMDTIAQENAFRNFYQTAGFKGKAIEITSTAHGFSIEYSYKYEEIIDGAKFEVDFPKERSISDDEKGEFFDTQEELAENFRSQLVEPFFEKSFEKSFYFQTMTQKIEFTLSQVGLKSNAIDLSYGFSSDKAPIILELKHDLKNKENEPLRGILHLDPEKYLKLGMYEIDVRLEEKLPGLTFDKLSIAEFPDGYYSFYYKDNETGGFTPYFMMVVEKGKIKES